MALLQDTGAGLAGLTRPHWWAVCVSDGEHRAPVELQTVGPAGVKPPGSGFGTSSKRPTHTRGASKGGHSPATWKNSTCVLGRPAQHARNNLTKRSREGQELQFGQKFPEGVPSMLS